MSSINRLIGIMNKSLQANAKAKAKDKAKAKAKAKTPSASEFQLQKLANNFLKSCEDRRFRGCKGFYKRHVSALAAARQFSLIDHILQHQKKFPDIRHEGFSIRLIELYGHSGMFGHARKLFDELPLLNCPRTVKSFNALLSAGIAAKEFATVVEVFEDLPSRVSLEPNLISHNTVIYALCEMGSVDDAVSRFLALEEKGKEPNVVTFNTLLNGLYMKGRFSEGERMWAMMSMKNVVPDVRSYNARLRGMLREGMVSEAVELVGAMESDGIERDSYTYNAMIRGLCCNGRFEEAKKWYDELRKSMCSPNLVSTYVTLVSACLESGDLRKTFEVCCDGTDHGLRLDADLIEKVVAGLAANGMNEEASKLEKLMSKN